MKVTKPKFYFYTDYDALNSGNNRPFGPEVIMSGATSDRYRFTELHLISSDKRAYAVCNGHVLYQNCATDPELVNIILKPSVSITHCPEVLFFIYRGIKRSSVVDLSGNLISPATNTITYKAKNSIHLGLGIDALSGYPDDDPIEEIFNTLWSNDLQLLKVNGGMCLGSFKQSPAAPGVTEGLGATLEILLKRVGFNPDLGLARKRENVLDIPFLSSAPTEEEELIHRYQKEQILNYLDVSAFYGNLFDYKPKVRARVEDVSVNPINPQFNYFGPGNEYGVDDYSAVQKNSEQLYDDILARFLNKNMVYLDIRNEHGFSFNFHKTYLDTLMISTTGSSYVEKNYYEEVVTSTDTFVWPLLRMDYSMVTSAQELKFKLPKGDNEFPLGYVQNGELKRTPKQKAERRSNGYANFVEFTYLSGTSSLYNSEEFELKLNIRSASAGDYVVCGYNRFKYLRKIDRSKDVMFHQREYIDFIFQPLVMSIPFKGFEPLKVNVYHEDVYIDLTREMGNSYVASIGVARDSDYTFFFAFAKERLEKNLKGVNNYFNLAPVAVSNMDSFMEYIIGLINPSDLTLSEPTITISEGTSTFSIQVSKFIFSKSPAKLELDLNREFILLVIPNDKYEDMLENALEAGLIVDLPVFLKAAKLSDPLPDVPTIDSLVPFCIKYDFQLIGYKLIAGAISVVETVSGAGTISGDTGIELFGHKYDELKNY